MTERNARAVGGGAREVATGATPVAIVQAAAAVAAPSRAGGGATAAGDDLAMAWPGDRTGMSQQECSSALAAPGSQSGSLQCTVPGAANSIEARPSADMHTSRAADGEVAVAR